MYNYRPTRLFLVTVIICLQEDLFAINYVYVCQYLINTHAIFNKAITF